MIWLSDWRSSCKRVWPDSHNFPATLTAESVTLQLPYSRDGDDYRYGYAQGRPAN